MDLTLTEIDNAIERAFSTSCLAPELRVGDVVLEAGLSGVMGKVTALRVGPEVVDVTLDDGARWALCRFEVLRVTRACPRGGTCLCAGQGRLADAPCDCALGDPGRAA